MYIQIKSLLHLYLQITSMQIMKIEDEIKSTVALDLSKKVMLNLIVAHNVVKDKFNEIRFAYDISGEQYNVLRILRGQKGKAVNMCEIQERMLSKSSNTTRLIDKLLLKNLVTRNVCPENRRKIEITITQKGLDILTELDPKVIENEEFFSKNLNNEELELLNSLLEKYRN